MSESLPVELNGDAVHAIDAPDTFTARGPFHLELTNEGGAVHVHVHLGDDLSQAARIRDVNHYVESGETARVPVGTVPGTGEVTGHLEIVSGYGTERERIEVTVVADARSDGRDGARRDRGADRAEPRQGRGSDDTKADTGAETRTVSASTGRTSTGHSMERPATGMGVRGLANRSLPNLPTVDTTTREGVAFIVLAAFAMIVGLAVILIVGDPVLSFVVAAVTVAAVAAAGWLLVA